MLLMYIVTNFVKYVLLPTYISPGLFISDVYNVQSNQLTAIVKWGNTIHIVYRVTVTYILKQVMVEQWWLVYHFSGRAQKKLIPFYFLFVQKACSLFIFLSEKYSNNKVPYRFNIFLD